MGWFASIFYRCAWDLEEGIVEIWVTDSGIAAKVGEKKWRGRAGKTAIFCRLNREDLFKFFTYAILPKPFS